MDKDQIVIISQMNDPHVDEVIVALQEIGHEPVRLNMGDVPLQTCISFDIGNRFASWRGSIDLTTNRRRITLDSIRSVWWWQPDIPYLPVDLSEQEREFAHDELEQLLQGIWDSLECYWMSHPADIRRASWRVSQLQRAAQLGFAIPSTLITMDTEQARAFYEQCNHQVIFKVLSDPFLGAAKMASKYPDQSLDLYNTPTTLLTEAEFALFNSFQPIPCLFQEYIPRQHDLRVTVIGNDLFAAEIHSQLSEATRIDWRYSDADIPCKQITLPSEIAERCLALVKSYDLNYCTLDLFLTTEGQYVFSESNPNGQFLFLEERLPELRMVEALTNCLIRGANS